MRKDVALAGRRWFSSRLCFNPIPTYSIMLLSLDWLGAHLDLDGLDVAGISDLLTFAGVEVEGVTQRGINDPNVVVAKVLAAEAHPNAARLKVCQVDAGDGVVRQIVCGATNYQVGDHVPLALPGAVLPDGTTIREGELRGVRSGGMMCSARELGYGDDHEGLMILGPDAPLGAPLADLFPADTLIEIEVTPNRPDLLGHYGLARELSAITGRPLKARFPDPEGIVPATRVRLESTTCPYYLLQVIDGVKVAPSPPWLRRRLESIGLRPINNIVDITNFVLHETGHPLHAFDAEQLDGGLLVVRHAREGESMEALDGSRCDPTPDDCVIADARQPRAIAGVMGGQDSGVTESTSRIFLESAWFVPSMIRRTSRRLGLSSDSSYRFERGADPEMVARASALATRLILELAGGSLDGSCESAGSPPVLTGVIAYDAESAGKFLGGHLGAQRQHGCLQRLGLKSTDGGANWQIPSFRADLQRPIDLIEEVARLEGLDSVPPRTAAAPASASPADAFHDHTLRLKQQLSGRGFCEARTLKLISARQAADSPHAGRAPVALRNPLSEDHTLLRPSLLPGLLAVLERNLNHGCSRLAFFETGTVFQPGHDGLVMESQSIAVVLSGEIEPRSWISPDPRNATFADLRGMLDLLWPAGFSPKITACELPGLILGANIAISRKETLGIAGQLHPARVRELGGTAPVYVAELSLDAIIGLVRSARPRFSELARFPSVTRDIAVEIPLDLPASRIENTLAQSGVGLLTGWSLFDVFADPDGNRLARDRRSLAWSLTYRDPQRTLRSEEVDAAHDKVRQALARLPGLTLRS